MILNLMFILQTLLPLQSNADKSSQNIVTNEIVAITVFLNNAEITRNGSVSIPSGKSDVIFNNISSRILENGIKLDLPDDVKIHAINIESDDEYYSKNNEYQKLEKEYFLLKDLISTEENRLDALEKETLYLEANMKLIASTINFTKIDEGIEYFKTKNESLQKRENIINSALELLLKQKKQLLKKREKLKNELKKVNSIVRVTLISNINKTCELKLKYLVSNALWRPNYSVRAKEQNQKIIIEYQAQIYNDTGNDWDNKPITLAILDSSDDIKKPELNTWNLEEDNNEYSTKPSYSRSKKGEKEDNTQVDQDYETLEVDDLSTRFELKELFLIPSDARPHLIDIATYEKGVEYYTLSIPKSKNGAFRIAQVKGWENIGLLDGNANLYLDNVYQGSSEFSTQQINDILEVSLGRDKNFNISRKKVSSKSQKSLIGFNIKEIVKYEILVKNNKNESGTISIKDQIPISNSKNIEIKPLNISNGQYDPLTGEVIWELSLEPNEIKKLKLEFSIKYPKKSKGIIKSYSKKITSPRFF